MPWFSFVDGFSWFISGWWVPDEESTTETINTVRPLFQFLREPGYDYAICRAVTNPQGVTSYVRVKTFQYLEGDPGGIEEWMPAGFWPEDAFYAFPTVLARIGRPLHRIGAGTSTTTALGSVRGLSGVLSAVLPTSGGVVISLKDAAEKLLKAGPTVVYEVWDGINQIRVGTHTLGDLLDVGITTSGQFQIGLKLDDTNRVWVNLTVQPPSAPQIAVDANRDGQIDFNPSDATSASTPYRFWINDDDDERVMRTWTSGSTYTENEQDDKEVTSDANKDCNNVVIDTERDLEDLARLWIQTAGIADSLKNGTLRLGLKWTDISSGGSPAVRLFKAVEADGGNAYLFNAGTAALQVDQTAAAGAHGMAVGSLIEGTNPVPLPTGLFANVSESQPKTHLLFEAARAGVGQLKLVILNQNDQPIGEGPGVWLDLKRPHEFVERYTCGDQSIGLVGALTHYAQSATFGAPTTEAERDYILYVHGYNMEDPEKQRWIETTFKRLYWLGYRGRVGGFSWPCAFGLIDQIRFDESEERAWQAGVRLLEHLQNLKNMGYRVHVVAHSQGNIVMSEALRQWRAAGNATALVNTYIASQAAVAAHCYNAAAPLMPDYAQTTPNVYAIYWRAGDSPRFPQTWPTTNPPYLRTRACNRRLGIGLTSTIRRTMR